MRTGADARAGARGGPAAPWRHPAPSRTPRRSPARLHVPLRTPIQNIVEHSLEQRWRAERVPEQDIRLSAQTGMNAHDVRYLRELTRARWLIIVRCPKRTARVWHGVLPPKPLAVKQKSGTSGVAVMRQIEWNADRSAFTVTNDDPRLFVSDYDLMSVWRRGAADEWVKIFMAASNGAPRGKWTLEAHGVARELNRGLVSAVQHGCQDDYHSAKNPNVSLSNDHFVAFADGVGTYLDGAAACETFYRKQGLVWPYDSKTGKYTGPIA